MRTLISLIGKIFLRDEIYSTKKAITEIIHSKNYLMAQNELLLSALIAGEDRRYLKHAGYDPIAIVRAIRNKILHNRTEGASTIEQQLTRTITGKYERTATRKIKEIIISCALSATFKKQEIAYCYISTAYYGWGMNNIQQAYSRLKLNNSSLTQLQAAKLIARLRYPEPQKPQKSRKQKILLRARYIMDLQKNHSTKEDLGINNAAI
ncbi:transglycosylase domain-containing protein [Pseudomonas sp. LMG 31766]|uniref:Transglycosylase domain-containing protein n=1 Tax=Pseudomonas chaetocerotis TaxID=2758695 RepID=A0A931D5M5_9PSED|nr:biosynthetic peptidoglycan transglycosylase [Pseudomonas chaetocerotis]MBZ9663866.1 transglycosylase domain-containing protein [Pseudomonas chaetocerotis]